MSCVESFRSAEPLAHIKGDETQSLRAHLEQVALWAAWFASAAGLPRTGELLGLLHDLGKATVWFQRYLLSAEGRLDQDSEDYVDAAGLKGKIDHSTAGAQWCWRRSGAGSKRMDALCRQIVALCLCSHHSGLIDCLGPDGEAVFAARMAKDDGKTRLGEALDTVGPDIVQRVTRLWEDEALPELRQGVAALFVSASRAHTSAANPLHPRCVDCPERGACRAPDFLGQAQAGLLARFLLSCLLDADRIDSADFAERRQAALRRTAPPDWSVLTERLETHLAELAARPGSARPAVDAVRRDIAAHCLEHACDAKGIFLLTVPTGGGKNLSGLRFALHHAARHGLRRVIHVVPYTSIIDQNAAVARAVLERDEPFGTVVLEQHSNIEPERDTWQSGLLAENWDAPVVYTTMVQFLESLFGGGTRGARRMHRLAEAVLVFDEIQTLPVSCTHLFCNAVNFLVDRCGATVVLCTATQPLLHRLPRPWFGGLDPASLRELMPDVNALYASLKRADIVTDVRPEGWSEEEVAERAMDEAGRTGSCLVVVNTKKWARKVCEAWRERGVADVVHLSTNMCPAHRLEVLHKLRGRLEHNRLHPEDKRSVLCVSTQLIEAGVDVDFASLIRCLAGLPSILQAAGRCNRNGLADRGTVLVVNPRREDLSRLPEIALGRETTLRILNELADMPDGEGDLLHPAVLERYFEYYFFQRRDAMLYKVPARIAGRDDTLVDILACNPGNVGNMGFAPALRQSFAVAGRAFAAIDAATEGVIVPYGRGRELIAALAGETDPVRIKALLREAQRYSVNVFPWRLDQLAGRRALYEVRAGLGVWYVADGWYDDAYGLADEAGSGQPLLYC